MAIRCVEENASLKNWRIDLTDTELISGSRMHILSSHDGCPTDESVRIVCSGNPGAKSAIEPMDDHRSFSPVAGDPRPG